MPEDRVRWIKSLPGAENGLKQILILLDVDLGGNRQGALANLLVKFLRRDRKA